MPKTEKAPPATRRLRFLESVSDDRWQYIAGQVAADVPAALADELVRTHQAEVTDAPVRAPVWAFHCDVVWIAERVLPDGRVVQRWTDDADQSPFWARCNRCGGGYYL